MWIDLFLLMLYFVITLLQSDCFYNAGWTEDARVVIDYLHHQYPKSPLFVIGTSIGANILVCYLVWISLTLYFLSVWYKSFITTSIVLSTSPMHLPTGLVYVRCQFFTGDV